MSDTDKTTGTDTTGSADPSDAEKKRTDDIPDGSSSEGSDDTDRDTASGGPAE
ncbi:hypothetical protein [Leifsonia poae]|uniref:Uncharacterized protein n=1 Tax=Leifsonia poae TaxID=110933 RepID=A0A9W6M0X7_9MICO|nr:hypothetical protein [Leifsonia poae]GLJ77129.1 hypothetical protein GCM10017584_27030 [Leifsonia poae]